LCDRDLWGRKCIVAVQGRRRGFYAHEMLHTFRQWDFGFILALRNLRCNEWWFRQCAGDVAAVRAEVKDSWELPVDVKQTVDEALSDLILQIVRFAAVFVI